MDAIDRPFDPIVTLSLRHPLKVDSVARQRCKGEGNLAGDCTTLEQVCVVRAKLGGRRSQTANRPGCAIVWSVSAAFQLGAEVER